MGCSGGSRLLLGVLLGAVSATAAALLLAACFLRLPKDSSAQNLAEQSADILRDGLPSAYKPFLGGSSEAPTSQWPDVTRVDAKLLISGSGEAVADGSVLFDASANRILYAGPSSSVPHLVANRSVQVETVMPGLWDCHTHFMGQIGDNLPFKDSGFLSAEFPVNYVLFHSALKELEEAITMGITSVREVGGPFGQAIHVLESSGRIIAPNFHYAGRCIGMTGGHADDQLLPLDEYRKMDREHVSGGALCDGVPECLKRERENLRMQADVIKIMTTGGVLSEFDQPTDAQLSSEEIRAITEDARRAKRAVAAHAHGTAGIQSAIDNGVTSIEHGSYMTREQAKQIKAKGYMVYTPTATIDQVFFNGTERPAGLDDNQWAKGRAMLHTHMKSIKMAIEEKVPIVAGTDCPRGCAMVGTEINYLHMLGMSPLEAIQAATGNAPGCLGQYGMAPKSGQLAAGYEADVIALDVNPLDRLDALTKQEHITHVWKAGKALKGALITEVATQAKEHAGSSLQVTS